jgi:hypothetical protein
MRKSLCFILAFGAFPESLLAQGAITVGGGLNSSSTSNNALFQPSSPPAPPGYNPEPSNRNGYNLGIGYERTMLRWLSLAAELNLETRGESARITHTTNPTAPVIDVELRLLYLQVPLLATLKYTTGPFSFGVFGGPSVSRMISGERERRVNGTAQPVEKAEVNRTDLGVEAGALGEWKFGGGTIFLRPGYYWGLLDFSEDHSAKHRVGKIRLGHKFFL